MALIDRIKYDGTGTTPWLIYKYPGEEFVLGSQLIVNAGQEALFFRGGEVTDVFGAGTHTLQSGNLPILKKLVNKPFGGKTPFSAEVYYVNKTSKTDMMWGTAEPFQAEDPKYGILLSVRAHGKYGIRINDSRKFVCELIGALPGGVGTDHSMISSYFSGVMAMGVKTVISSFMINKGVSFLEITPYLKELSAECEKELRGEFDRYGAELVNFYIDTISPPKEDYEKLRGYKEELALGNDFYKQRRTFDVLETMAGNSAGGMASAGMGLGMGFGMMQNTQGMFGNLGNVMSVSGADSTPAGGTVGGAAPAAPTAAGGRKCTACGMENPVTSRFCGGCGTQIPTDRFCTSCGNKLGDGMRFCGNCGAKV